MELHQIIGCTADLRAASRGAVDLDGVAVIDDAKRHHAVRDIKATEVSPHGATQLDRCLLEAEFADFEIWRELAPALGRARAVIAPMRMVTLCFCSGAVSRTYAKRARCQRRGAKDAQSTMRAKNLGSVGWQRTLLSRHASRRLASVWRARYERRLKRDLKISPRNLKDEP